MFWKKSPTRSVPTVKIDQTLVTHEIEKFVKDYIDLEIRIPEDQKDVAFDYSMRSIRAGRNLFLLANKLKDMGISKSDSAEIARTLNNRATVLMSISRQRSLGLTHARWRFGNAPCGMRDLPADKARSLEDLHKSFDGKKYPLATGLKSGRGFHFPGWEVGCKCTSSVIVPGFDD